MDRVHVYMRNSECSGIRYAPYSAARTGILAMLIYLRIGTFHTDIVHLKRLKAPPRRKVKIIQVVCCSTVYLFRIFRFKKCSLATGFIKLRLVYRNIMKPCYYEERCSETFRLGDVLRNNKPIVGSCGKEYNISVVSF